MCVVVVMAVVNCRVEFKWVIVGGDYWDYCGCWGLELFGHCGSRWLLVIKIEYMAQKCWMR